MWSVEGLREFINDRLNAVGVEIFAVVEQTIVQYQEEVNAQILDINWRGETKTQTKDASQNTTCKNEEFNNQEMNPSVHQEEAEPPQIKEEQEDICTGDGKEEYPIPPDSGREFMEDLPTTANGEIFNVFEQTIAQYQEEVDAQLKSYKKDKPEQLLCKEELHCDLEADFRLDQEEPEPPQVKENYGELCTTLEGEELVQKQEANVFLMTFPNNQSDQSESGIDERPLYHDSAVSESQGYRKAQFSESESVCKAELHSNGRGYSKSVGESSTSENQCETDTDNKCLKCEICGKTFKLVSHLQQHFRAHTAEKHFFCAVCGKGFRHHSVLLRHRRTHAGEKPISCGTCGKSFTEHSQLLAHIKSHTKEGPYSCGTCGKTFCHRRYLVAHRRSHSEEKLHACIICDKSFNAKGNLSRHMKTHTGEKPFPCPTCGTCFSQQNTLFRHMRTHTGLKLFSCQTCGKNFSRQDNLLVHTRNSHIS